MITQIAKSVANACGLTLARREHAGSRFLEHPPKTILDHILLHVFPTLRGLNFIQIGANDGSRADPISGYLGPYLWTGSMFEPREVNFTALSRLHAANPRLTLSCAAVDTVAGKRTIYDVDHARFKELPEWAYGLASFSPERVLEALAGLGLGSDAMVTENVSVVTWTKVWSDFGSKRCNLLVLDTEGYDLTLLRAAGLSDHRPQIIHFEHACVSSTERLEFYKELIELDYEIATDGPDTTAWSKS